MQRLVEYLPATIVGAVIVGATVGLLVIYALSAPAPEALGALAAAMLFFVISCEPAFGGWDAGGEPGARWTAPHT